MDRRFLSLEVDFLATLQAFFSFPVSRCASRGMSHKFGASSVYVYAGAVAAAPLVLWEILSREGMFGKVVLRPGWCTSVVAPAAFCKHSLALACRLSAQNGEDTRMPGSRILAGSPGAPYAHRLPRLHEGGDVQVMGDIRACPGKQILVNSGIKGHCWSANRGVGQGRLGGGRIGK